MKRTAAIFCLIFLLIPTYFIISFLISGQKTPISFRDITKTIIQSSSSYTYELEYDEKDPDSTLFYRMLESKSTVSSIPSDVLKLTPYKVSFISGDFVSDYEFYLGKSADKNYIVQRDGVSVIYYQISSKAGSEFLDSKFSEGVYPDSKAPSLLLDSREVVSSSIEWFYKTTNGDYKQSLENKKSDEIIDIGGLPADFRPSFSSQPSSVTLKVSDTSKNDVIYSGSADDFTSVTVTDNLNVRIDITAVFPDSGESYGTINYTIYAKLYAPLYFYISEPQTKEGGIILLSLKNVLKPDTIIFESEPSLDYSPTFFKDGDYYRALLPIPYECTDNTANYKLKISADGTQKETTLLVLNSSYDSAKISGVSSETINSIGGIKTQPYSSLYAAISGSIAQYSNYGLLYTRGTFSNGYEKGIHRAYFGTSIEYFKVPGQVYISPDHVYVGNRSDPITAMNTGMIVYMDKTTYTGGLIVIDHGFGLLSWYWNIGTFNNELSCGQLVEKGKLLGYNGGGGLSEQYNGNNNSCHIAITVFDRPIDEKYLIASGLIVENR